jgi:hypothetical protein
MVNFTLRVSCFVIFLFIQSPNENGPVDAPLSSLNKALLFTSVVNTCYLRVTANNGDPQLGVASVEPVKIMGSLFMMHEDLLRPGKVEQTKKFLFSRKCGVSSKLHTPSSKVPDGFEFPAYVSSLSNYSF